MKKILSLMLVAIMLISLFACGKQNENTSGTTESTASDTTSDRTSPDATTSASETTTETQATTETTSQEWKYKEVPYAEESYYKLFLNGKEISGYKILIYQTSESIYPERAIVADGEAMFVTKHMLGHDDEIPTYEYKAGDKFEIESVGNSRMRFYAVYDIEGNKLEYDGKDRFYPIENIDTLGAGTYYLGFSVVEERNEHLFKGSEYYEGIYYIKTESYLYIKITIE
ncbi:MAG TPA: hypothetical protein DD628_06600 [Clostridiales bacterium]|nr:hypothetical protein [Candidatus Apopatosoma intestinale]